MALPTLVVAWGLNVSVAVGQVAAPAPDASLQRVFRELVGRAVGPDELRALRGKTYDEAVEATLGSQQFQDEGFYAFMRSRLVLGREGSQRAIDRSRPDFCALRLEMSESALADETGTDGHWTTLRYRERWVPISEYSPYTACFVGTDVDKLIEAYDTRSTGAPSEPPYDPARSRARSCIEALKSYFPGAGAIPSLVRLKTLMQELKGLPAATRQKSLIDATQEGESLLLAAINRGSGPLVKPLGDVTLVRQNGHVVFMQELGAVRRSDCEFGVVDASSHGRRDVQSQVRAAFPMVRRPALGSRYAGIVRSSEDGQTASINVEGASGALFVRVLARDAIGVHASRFWLSTHRSTVSNQQLHRARLVYHSYFCTSVSPEAATDTGESPVLYDELLPYFSAEDVHKNGSSNCYNCHALVQPLANFFGRLDNGADYETSFGQFAFLATINGFTRPGGLWEGERFFPAGGEGLVGLDDLLSKHPAVRSCIVRRSWEELVGGEHPLTPPERTAAAQAFDDGAATAAPASLTRLLRYFLLVSPRGRAYGERGSRALDDLSPPPQPACAEVPDEGQVAAAHASAERTCWRCHRPGRVAPTLFDAGGGFAPSAVGAAELGSVWQRVTCAVGGEVMPPPSSAVQPSESERASMACVFRRTRNDLARLGDIPAAYFEQRCADDVRRLTRPVEGHP